MINFIEQLTQLNQHPRAEVRTFFEPGQSIFAARAPGRLDVMGGIADYSGSLVLQLPIAEATAAAIQPGRDGLLTIISLGNDRPQGISHFTMPMADLASLTYETAAAHFQRDPANHWAAYVAGILLVLMQEKKLLFNGGARILIHSEVPEGKGVSSSAALEVAVMTAAAAAFAVELPCRELALLCQIAENRVVGAPCGVMDQMTAACGQANHLLALLCQPAEIQGHIALPAELSLWGLDSGIRHAVSGADYSSVRIGAFMGYKMLQAMAGHNWGGYLANLTPSLFMQQYEQHLPLTMAGADFLRQYGETDDTVTAVNPHQLYTIRQPTAHPIYEHFRVQTFARLLAGDALANAAQLGELMYQSHASYSACGLGSPETDRLVALARQQPHIFGAKITGGGSGGTVALLARGDGTAAVQTIAHQYAAQTGRTPTIFRHSSPGAATFAPVTVGGYTV
jgi:L-arabinokinase